MTGTSGQQVAAGTTSSTGKVAFTTTARATAVFVATAAPQGTAIQSPRVRLRVRPALRARLFGRRVVGSSLLLRGRLLPARSGRLSLAFHGRVRGVRVRSTGAFRVRLRTGTEARARAALRLAPARGYARVSRRFAVRLRRPALSLGATGVAVHALERRLRQLHYALRRVDRRYRSDTYSAVLAFQKVHGLPRTGRVGRTMWRALTHSGIPRALFPRGNHVEVDKGRQVLFEVVRGSVARVVHVSTGATGNTPVGRFRVYHLTPGYNALHMYYTLYFLRGFAIHGYPSVPPYPASHGCVRTPIWFAPGFYARWGRIGTVIRIFA
ncbi:MAG: L,D-transpeptidase family protein [Actinomycetota bacterium]|nr:L,D-transpeptidase family protein [Actinomycetota bacterium]